MIGGSMNSIMVSETKYKYIEEEKQEVIYTFEDLEDMFEEGTIVRSLVSALRTSAAEPWNFDISSAPTGKSLLWLLQSKNSSHRWSYYGIYDDDDFAIKVAWAEVNVNVYKEGFGPTRL